MKNNKNTIWITTPQGNTVEISFAQFALQCYDDSIEKKNRLSFRKYMLLKRPSLMQQWQLVKADIEKQALKNQMWHRKLWLKAKYSLKTLLFRTKTALKSILPKKST